MGSPAFFFQLHQSLCDGLNNRMKNRAREPDPAVHQLLKGAVVFVSYIKCSFRNRIELMDGRPMLGTAGGDFLLNARAT